MMAVSREDSTEDLELMNEFCEHGRKCSQELKILSWSLITRVLCSSHEIYFVLLCSILSQLSSLTHL